MTKPRSVFPVSVVLLAGPTLVFAGTPPTIASYPVVSADTVVADDATPYTVTMTANDADGTTGPEVPVIDFRQGTPFSPAVRGQCPYRSVSESGIEVLWDLQGLNEEASAVCVRVLDGPGPEMILTDVQLRSAGPAETRWVKVRIVDLDGDGQDEILSWTTEGELAVVAANGTGRWRKDWRAGIIAVDAWDLDDDKAREVFVSLADRRVVVLNTDGSPRWEKDFSDMHRQTDERFFGDGSVVYGLAAWQPGGATTKEILLTSYFYAARLDAGGELKGSFKRSGHFTQVRAVPSHFPRGGDLVLRSDIPWVGPVPLEWWRASTGEVDAVCSVPNGRAVFFEVDDYDGDGTVEALIATEQGIGLYSPTDPNIRWQHMTEAPPAGVGVITPPSKAPATVIYGREDGYLFVMQADGTLVRSTVLDEPIRCLTALRTRANGSIILVGTDASLLCLGLGDLAAVWQRPGSYRRLELLRGADGPRVLAITRGGQLEALDCVPLLCEQ